MPGSLNRLRALTSWIIGLLLVLLLAGCSPEPTDPSQPIEVESGERFDIVLEANPSTGYEWRLLRPEDEMIVRLVEQDYRADQPVTEGSGGVGVWTFEAAGSGAVTIELGYFPPGSTVEEPQETRTFDVTVR